MYKSLYPDSRLEALYSLLALQCAVVLGSGVRTSLTYQCFWEDALVLAVVKGKAGKSQHSTAVRSGRGGSARSKTSTKGKPRPRKRAKVDIPMLDWQAVLAYACICTCHCNTLDSCQGDMQGKHALHHCNAWVMHLQVLQYMDDDDIDGVGDLHDDDDADDDFQAPGTSAAARKRLEPML